MTTQNIGILKALTAKMDYLDQRQRVISQNIANADTPDYKPNDLKPVDFSSLLKTETGRIVVRPQATHPDHMPPPGEVRPPKNGPQDGTYEVAPAGNAVVLEEQLIASNQTVMDYNLMTNLYQKNVAMFRTVIGR
ncbi:MAG: flagellar basal body rod protein FlgB [Alphaproteobacteria bacterium]|nr:flagellar basal body rod protein FlgB [Alphaproteobacteria bacterium]